MYNSYYQVYTYQTNNTNGNITYEINGTESCCTAEDNCLDAYAKNGTYQKYLWVPDRFCSEFSNPPTTRYFIYNNQTTGATQGPSCYYAVAQNGTKYPYYDQYNNHHCVQKCQFYWFNYREDLYDLSVYDKYCTRTNDCDFAINEDGVKLSMLKGDQCTAGCPNDKIYHINNQMPYQCISSCPSNYTYFEEDQYGSRQCLAQCDVNNKTQQCRYLFQTCDETGNEDMIEQFQSQQLLSDEYINQNLYYNGVLTIPCGVVNLKSVFRNYTQKDQVTKVVIPDSVTKFIGNQSISSNKTEYEGVFQDFVNLYDVELPYGLAGTGIATFYNCTSLQSIYIPSNVINIQNYTFAHCKKLQFINIPEQATIISSYAFYYCTNLQNIQLPDQIQEIGHSSFYGCNQIIKVDIPSNVKVIEIWAFAFCDQLAYVNIPLSVERIQSYSFYKCDKLICVTIQNQNCQIEEDAFEYTDYNYTQVSQFDDTCNIQNLVSCLTDDDIKYLIIINEKEKCIDPSSVYYYIQNNYKNYVVDECPEDRQFIQGSGYPYECVSECQIYPYYKITELGQQCVKDCYEPYARPYGDYNKLCDDQCYYYVYQGISYCKPGNGCSYQNYSKLSYENDRLCLEDCEEGQYVYFHVDYNTETVWYCKLSCNQYDLFVQQSGNLCVSDCEGNTWSYINNEKKCKNDKSCDYENSQQYLLEDTKECINESQACPTNTGVKYYKNDSSYICQVSKCDNPEYYHIDQFTQDDSNCIEQCDYVWYYMNVTESQRKRTVKICNQYQYSCPPTKPSQDSQYNFVLRLTKKSQNNICVSKCQGSGYDYISYNNSNECQDDCQGVWQYTNDNDKQCRNEDLCRITVKPPEIQNNQQCIQCQQGYNYVLDNQCMQSCYQYKYFISTHSQKCVQQCEDDFWTYVNNEKQCQTNSCNFESNEYAIVQQDQKYQCVQSCPYNEYVFKYNITIDQQNYKLCLEQCHFRQHLYIYKNQECVESCMNTIDKYIQGEDNCVNNCGQNTWCLSTGMQYCNYNEACDGGFLYEQNNNQCVDECQEINSNYKFVQDGKCVSKCNQNVFKYTFQLENNIICVKSCAEVEEFQYLKDNVCTQDCGDNVWYYKDREQQCSNQTSCIYNNTVKEFILDATQQCINETQACPEYYGTKVYKINDQEHSCQNILCSYYKDVYDQNNLQCLDECDTIQYDINVTIDKSQLEITICDTKKYQCPPTQNQGQIYQFLDKLVKQSGNYCFDNCYANDRYVSANNNNLCVNQCENESRFIYINNERVCTNSAECPPNGYPQYVKYTYLGACQIKCQDDEQYQFVQESNRNQCKICDNIWRLENDDKVCYEETECSYNQTVKEYLLQDTKQCIKEEDACPKNGIYFNKNEYTRVCKANFCKIKNYYYVDRYNYNDVNCIENCYKVSYLYNVTETKQVPVCMLTKNDCPPVDQGEYSKLQFISEINEEQICVEKCQNEQFGDFNSYDNKYCVKDCTYYNWKTNQTYNGVFYLNNGVKQCTQYHQCSQLQNYPKTQQMYYIHTAYTQCVNVCDSKIWQYFNGEQMCVSECSQKQMKVLLNTSDWQCIQSCQESEDQSKVYQQANICTDQCYDEYATPAQKNNKICDNSCTFYIINKNNNQYLQCTQSDNCPQNYQYSALLSNQRKQCSSSCTDIAMKDIKYIKNNQCVNNCSGKMWIQVNNQNKCTTATECDQLSTQTDKYVQDEEIEDKCILYDPTVQCTQNNFRYQQPQSNKCVTECKEDKLWYYYNSYLKVCTSQYQSCSQIKNQLNQELMQVEGTNQCVSTCPQIAQVIYQNKCVSSCPSNMYILKIINQQCVDNCQQYNNYVENKVCVEQCNSSIWDNINNQKQCITQQQCMKQNKFAFVNGTTNQCIQGYNQTQLNNTYHINEEQKIYIYNNVVSCEQIQNLINIIVYQVNSFQCQRINCNINQSWYYKNNNQLLCLQNCKEANLYGYELVKHQCVTEEYCQQEKYSIQATIQDAKCNYIENMNTCQDYYNYQLVKRFIIQQNDKLQCIQCKSNELKIKYENDTLVCKQEEQQQTNNKQSNNSGQIAVIIILSVCLIGFIAVTIVLILQNKKLKQNKDNSLTNKQQSRVIISKQNSFDNRSQRNLALQETSYNVSQLNNQNDVIQQLQQPIQMPEQQNIFTNQVKNNQQSNIDIAEQQSQVSQQKTYEEKLFDYIPEELKAKPDDYKILDNIQLQQIQQSSLMPVKYSQGQQNNDQQVKHKKKIVKIVKKKKHDI